MIRYLKTLKSFTSREAMLMPAGGRSLTIPNQAVQISDAITRFSAPSILEKIKGYYEEEGMELPNFDRLDKVERLQLLADVKAGMFAAKEKAENAFADAKAKAEADAKAKADTKAKESNIPNESKTEDK